MKTKISILLLMIAFAFGATAQSIGDFIDVVHLKNGTMIKGVIIEQVPGQSIKIQIPDGKVMSYSIYDVAKFTREARTANSTSTLGSAEGKTCTKSKEACASKASCKDKAKCASSGKSCCSKSGKSCCGISKMLNGDYKKKDKGFYTEIGLLGNSSAYAFRLTNGYKFGRLAYLGLAIGFENVKINDGQRLPEFSLNLVYAGDILDRKITPFYQVEAGYGFSMDRYGYNSNILNGDNIFSGKGFGMFGHDHDDIDIDKNSASTLNYGGPQGALALGVKIHTQKKIYFKLGLDARLTSNFSDVHYLNFDNSGLVTGTTIEKNVDVNPGLGARFTVGF